MKHAFITFFVGYFLAAYPFQFHWLYLLFVSSGFIFIAAASAVFNHVLESRYDALMSRTAGRPIVTGEVSRRAAFCFGMALVIIGTLILYWATAYYTLFWSWVMMILYNFIYTPLKRVTWLNTYIGSLPGALPPVCGWVAISDVSFSLLVLFSVFFIWQIPHFFSLAWKYRFEYNRAGFKMLPTFDQTGSCTGWHTLISSFLLGCSSLWLKQIIGFTWFYGVGALLISLYFFYFAVIFFRFPTDANARSVFLASIMYQPILVCLMLVDRVFMIN